MGSMKIKFLFLSTLLLAIPFKALPQAGILNGYVTDTKTQEPLIGVTVVVTELKGTGAATDQEGKFRITVPVGSYSIKFSMVGYQTVVKTDVVVKSGSETPLIVKLTDASIELEKVTVTAEYFDKSLIDNNLSTVVLGPEEIRKSPGSAQDFQRILQGMAGVSFSNDQNNELLVRGGAPDENLTVLDHMEIHSTNHYPNQYNSGGPINMVNVDLIQDIQFSTGGFISKYGDKLSSALNITTSEGTREKPISANTNLSMAGYGTVLEGAINGGRGSWIMSARKSYVDLVAGAFGLTAIPKYYDLQFKAAYDASTEHKLSLSGIYGNDLINIDGQPDNKNISLAGSADSLDINNVYVKQHQYAVGLTLKSIWSDKVNSFITLSNNSFYSNVLVTNDYTVRNYNGSGDVASTNRLSRRKIYDENDDNGETTLKAEFLWNTHSTNELSFGGAVNFVNLNSVEGMDADTVRYDVNKDGVFDTTVVVPSANINYHFPFGNYYKGYSYVNDRLKLFSDRLIMNMGLRYDYFSYSGKATVSPRFSASYAMTDLTNINFAAGNYYQTPALPLYGDRYQSEVNRYLESAQANHFVLGIEHILDDGLKVNVEGYLKKYSDITEREEFIHFYDRAFRSEKILNVGKQDVYGIDFLLQQKLVKDIYGTVSFSRMWTKYYDPRIGKQGATFPSDNDFPYVLTVIVGKRFTGLRSGLNEMPFYIRYPSYVLPFSDDMEISLRWRYATGKPFTPQDFVVTEQHREGAIKWSKGAWVPSDNINSERYPDYSRLDIAFNSRYNFSNWNLVVYLSIQNLYNRKNIAFYQYNSDGSRENVYQFAILPVVGVEVEF
jgi:hypothetical protein